MSFATSLRIVLGVIGLWGALFAPPWVPIFCIVALALRWSAPECVLLGLLIDLLWLPTMMPDSLPLFTIASIVVVWGLDPLRHEFLR